MKLQTLWGLAALFMVYGCSSSTSSSSDEVGSESSEGDDSQTLRLISQQISFADGSNTLVSYDYDQAGNLVGRATDSTVLTYNIDTDGRILSVEGTSDGVPLEASLFYFYDEIGGLRRIDNVPTSGNGNLLGVSGFRLYEFTNTLATSLEWRIIPFEEIVPNGLVDDSAGFVQTNISFEYDNGRLVRELVDNNGDDVVDIYRDYVYNPDGTLSSATDTGASVSSYVYSYEQGECNLNWGNSTHRYFCVLPR